MKSEKHNFSVMDVSVSGKENCVNIVMSGVPIIFHVNPPALPLSEFARVTAQSLRGVQQQADKGTICVMQDKVGRERQVNMVYEFLRALHQATEQLKAEGRSFN